MSQANFPIQALGEYLLVKLDPEEKMAGLMELPPDAIEPVFTGTIVSVGKDAPSELEVGSRVRWLFPLGSCFTMPEDKDDEVQYARIHESDLVGVFAIDLQKKWAEINDPVGMGADL